MANYVIVGGSSGIGLALALQLKAEGHEVVALSRNNAPALEEAGITHLVWDVLSEPFPTQELPDVVHGLAYCPGSITLKPFHGLKLDDFQRDLNINLFGAVKAIQALLPALKKASGASVVLFSTVAVGKGMPFHASIAAAKGAIEGLVVSAAAEYAAAGIRFNAIAPSLTDTPLAGRLLSTPEKIELSAKRHPLGRVGTAADIASMAAFLIGEKSTWITGQVLAVDGGMSTVSAG